ncbi:uncharacterized protein LOC122300207 isoform X2 [Carya illinoinensis]|uniref:Uncharacterized protein n=1 Tax=Carya illinoinensis TaxID=32201 RepID=A0A8T1RBP7_CARIL|nr:uncharacterized protein LOC122300207 isoform X2 [Carya illinoinensis]KAG6663974.1 hypothetical protein CIPAW_02G059000 [Carya illinoinensis]
MGDANLESFQIYCMVFHSTRCSRFYGCFVRKSRERVAVEAIIVRSSIIRFAKKSLDAELRALVFSPRLMEDSSKDWRTYTKDWQTYTMLVELLDQSWWSFACFGWSGRRTTRERNGQKANDKHKVK